MCLNACLQFSLARCKLACESMDMALHTPLSSGLVAWELDQQVNEARKLMHQDTYVIRD